MRQRENELLAISPEVRAAVESGSPVVALESTIVTHGMPYPQNLETAAMAESVIREHGAIPATIALIGGHIAVGLNPATLDRVASGGDAVKASRRDLAALLVKGATGGTTVAATMVAARLAGIPIFATGGIGGVHRGAEQTFDISADLRELGATPVAVVCAGAKSILDLAKTLEFLETEGVPVLGYRCDEFPAFFSRTSGHKVDHRFDSALDLARVIASQRRLGLSTGMLIANPIPEEDAVPALEMEEWIDAACVEAVTAGISRKELTPYLLARINEMTDGRSLRANIALIRSNAALAANIAVELARLNGGERP